MDTVGKGQLLYQRAKELIPGGTQLLSKRPEMFAPDVWPSYYSRAKGCKVWDLDNNEYMDMSIMAVGACIIGYSDDDIKQELSVIIVEGINAVDPSKKVKLSTFLHTHLRNKLISKIKSINKLSNDACALRGNQSKSGEEAAKHRRSREELNFTSMAKVDPSSGEEYCEFQDTLANSDALYSEDGTIFERIDLELAIGKLEGILDEKTYAILRKVCLEGFSIKDAANDVGLTGWAASMRLKKLSKHKIVVDMLGDILG